MITHRIPANARDPANPAWTPRRPSTSLTAGR